MGRGVEAVVVQCTLKDGLSEEMVRSWVEVIAVRIVGWAWCVVQAVGRQSWKCGSRISELVLDL